MPSAFLVLVSRNSESYFQNLFSVPEAWKLIFSFPDFRKPGNLFLTFLGSGSLETSSYSGSPETSSYSGSPEPSSYSVLVSQFQASFLVPGQFLKSRLISQFQASFLGPGWFLSSRLVSWFQASFYFFIKRNRKIVFFLIS